MIKLILTLSFSMSFSFFVFSQKTDGKFKNNIGCELEITNSTANEFNYALKCINHATNCYEFALDGVAKLYSGSWIDNNPACERIFVFTTDSIKISLGDMCGEFIGFDCSGTFGDKLFFKLNISSEATNQVMVNSSLFDKMQGYFIGTENPKGPVVTDNGNANKTYTKEDPLVSKSETLKSKSGSDSIVIHEYYIGKFIDGLPSDKIEKYQWYPQSGLFLNSEYYFSATGELTKVIGYSLSGIGAGELTSIIEFTGKVYMKSEKYSQGKLIRKDIRTGQTIKMEEWYPDETKKSVMTLTIKSNENNIKHYMAGWPSSNKNGANKEWNSNGKLIKDFTYVNGQENGKCTEYYEDGKVKEFHNYTNGVKNGKYALYTTSEGYGPKNSEGTPTLQEGTYVNGKRTSFKLYKRDGTFKTLAD